MTTIALPVLCTGELKITAYCIDVSTHIRVSLASFLWDIGKQNSPKCDATKRIIPSGAILFAEKIFIEKSKNTLDVPKNESGLIQMIRMCKSIHH